MTNPNFPPDFPPVPCGTASFAPPCPSIPIDEHWYIVLIMGIIFIIFKLRKLYNYIKN